MARPNMRSFAYLLGGCLSVAVACGGSDDGGLLEPGEDGGGASALDGGAGASEAGAGTGGGSGEGGGGGDGGGEGGEGGVSGGGGEGGADVDASAGSGGEAGTSDGGPSADGAAGAAGMDACTNPARFYADADADGFGDGSVFVDVCTVPKGYVTNRDDCYDGNAKAKPGQMDWFTTERGDGSYDYDCDDASTKHFTDVGACSIAICYAIRAGWQQSVAECGVEKAWITNCVGLAFCAPQTELRKQECR